MDSDNFLFDKPLWMVVIVGHWFYIAISFFFQISFVFRVLLSSLPKVLAATFREFSSKIHVEKGTNTLVK